MQTARNSEQESRGWPRVRATLPASLFLPDCDREVPCVLIDISAEGAGLACREVLAASERIVLYIAGFGRFDAQVMRCGDGVLGLRLPCKEAKRRRLMENIALLERDGFLPERNDVRRRTRTPSLENGHFHRANGQLVRFDCLDVSLDGISLLTNARPPLGEILFFGKNLGQVVRHHDCGIAVVFLDRATLAPRRLVS